jgi:hypothetical protein
MWALDNLTPYSAERNWTRDKAGMHVWLVAVRATFDIDQNGRLKLADEQPPPGLLPEYTGEPGQSSLRLDSDLLYPKASTDVIAAASAYAPKGRPRDTVTVTLRVGPLYKELKVFGNRVYYKGAFGLQTTPPAPFVSQPITYEGAFGGTDFTDKNAAKWRMDDRNPIGKGFTVDPERLVHQPAHVVEYANGNPAKAGPAGFGPIDPAWMPRRQRAGTYDKRWEQTKKPLLPDDYDQLYASSAPDDQRIDRPLRGGERVELTGMTPSGFLVFDLPKILLAFITRINGRREEHRAHLATVFLMPDASQVSLVWQTSLNVAQHDGDYLDETRIYEKEYI